MSNRHKKGDIVNSLFWGTLILLTGVTLLGVNTGYVSGHVWGNLWKLWPVLLIVWGLNIILRNTSLQFLSYLSPLILILAFAYAAWWAPIEGDNGGWHFPKYIGLSRPESREVQDYSFKYSRSEEIHDVDVELDLGAARLSVEPSNEDAFVNVLLKTNIGEPTVNFELEGNTLKAYAASPRGGITWGDYTQEWHILLPAATPVSLNLDVGASDCELDLADMLLTYLEIDAGAAALTLNLPAPDVEGYAVDLDVGASDLNLTFPEGAPVRIDFDGGLSSTNFGRAGLKKDDGFWYSEAYKAGTPFADLSITSGVASVDLAFE